MLNSEGDLKISFGYKCNSDRGIPCEVASGCKILPGVRRTSSFSCFSGAALSANATLANTNICNGKIGEEIPLDHFLQCLSWFPSALHRIKNNTIYSSQ